jgi:hypothetical protein
MLRASFAAAQYLVADSLCHLLSNNNNNGNNNRMGGGVTWTTANTPSLVVTTIVGGAHHLELRHSNPKDPQSVIDARNLNRQWITTWINQANHPDDTSSSKLSSGALIAITAAVTAVVIGATCWCYNRRSSHDGHLQGTYNNVDQ